MSPKMLTCPSCSRHVLVSSMECPHCGCVVADGGRLLKSAGAAMLGLALVGCPASSDLYGVPDTRDTQDSGDTGDSGEDSGDDTGEIQDLYGVPDTGMYTDNDGDGYSEADGDCDDSDASVHPGADETPGDGIDSNCDGSDDT